MKKDKLKGKYFDSENNPTKAADVFAWVCERMIYHGIMWSTTGRVCVKDHFGEFREMNLNHVKAIVRRDYIQAFGEFHGLNGIIDDVILFNRERLANADPAKCLHAHVSGKLNS